MTVALGLVAALLWAVTDLVAQRVTRGAGALSAGFWVLLAGCPPAIALALLFDGVPTSTSLHGLGWACLAGVLDGVAVLLLMRALGHGELAIIGPLTALEGAFASLGSIALLGEHLGAIGIVALVAAAGGGALAATTSPRVRSPGAVPALLAALLFGIILLLMSRATGAGAMTVVAVTRCVSTLTLAPIAVAGHAARLPGRRFLLLVSGTAALDVIGFGLYVTAVHHGPFTLAAIASTQFATFAAILGILFLHERPRPHQLVGIALTVVGVSLLSSA
jgi:drug/metabolite transporter (DMT)-like permease